MFLKMNLVVLEHGRHYLQFHPRRLSKITANMEWVEYQNPLLRLHVDSEYLFWSDRESVPGRFLSIFAIPLIRCKM